MNGIRIEQTRRVHEIQNSATAEALPGTSSAVPTMLLPEPIETSGVAGDALAQIAALLSQLDSQDQRANRAMETAMNMASAHENAEGVKAMRDKATDIRLQGWAQGIGEIGAGAFKLGAGVTTAQDGRLDVNDVCCASAKGFEGAGSIVGNQFQAAAVLDDANVTAHSAAAKSDDQLAQEAHQDAVDARSALEKAYAFLKGVRDAQNSALAAAASLRG